MNVALVGAGPIGLELARAILPRSDLRLVAVVDTSPSLIGRPLRELLSGREAGGGGGAAPDPLGDLRICGELGAALARTEPAEQVEAVALCTSSRLDAVVGDLLAAVEAGVHVVSSCEELASPPDSPALRRVDESARRRGVTVVGTGVNPGFVMDRLPLQLAGVCVRVDGVRVERVVDAGKRRGPLRRKVGEGLTVAEFERGVSERRLGHVGLVTSAALIARGLGTSLSRCEEEIAPVVGADGLVLGVRQRLVAATADGRPIELTLQMSVGADDPHDRVVLAGDPPLDTRIEGGTHGDRATLGALIHALVRLHRAPRGVITVVELY